MFWEILQNIQCCQSRHGDISEWVTHLHARMQASSRCCSEAQRGWHQSLSYETHRAHRFHHNLPTLDPVVAGPLVRRCCQIFCLPRYAPSVIFPVVFLAEECVESEMTQLEESSFIWRERRQSLTLNMLLREKRGKESYDWCLFVDCWHVVVSDMNQVPRWRWIPGDPYERKPPLYIRVLDPLTPLQNICMSTHEGPQSSIRRQKFCAQMSEEHL